MIVIGKTRIVRAGTPDEKTVAAEVFRATRGTLDGHFGRDSGRPLVVGFRNGDLLSLRPKGTRQEVSVALKDVYAWVLRSRALRRQLEKARNRKAVLKQKHA